MDPTLGVIIAASVGALGAYLAAAKRFSGKIASSDAADLWKESSAIREWSGNQITVLNVQVQRLEQRVEGLEGSNAELTRENRTLLRENVELRDQLRTVHRELAQCRERVTELEASVG